jgi:hypothetical protein
VPQPEGSGRINFLVVGIFLGPLGGCYDGLPHPSCGAALVWVPTAFSCW